MSGAGAESAEEGLFERIRLACAEVARLAEQVRIRDDRLEALAALLCRERPRPPAMDPTGGALGGPERALAFVLTLDAVNFGSGWFPHLRKRPGLSGSRTIEAALRERFEKEGPIPPAELRRMRPADCAALFGQPAEPPLDELLALQARALSELGAFLETRYEGRFAGPVEAARHRAERLVRLLAEGMPLYRDVARYQGFAVPFYKRAQITCADLAGALRGEGLGRFEDLDRLTLFADNLVPHVLRMLGVLAFDGRLELRIERGELLAPGSEAEVEIRAVGLHAVERLAESCARRGWPVRPRVLDALLWSRGQRPAMKAQPRHRTRCAFY